jgi:retron-type reverse transcriptase
MLNEEMLKDSWQFIRKNAASGVDRVSAKEYEQNLDENIHQLVEDLKRKRYRAKLVRRVLIPKENGKTRPLGIPIWRSHCTSYSRVGYLAIKKTTG